MTLKEAIDDIEAVMLQMKAERDRYRVALMQLLAIARDRQDIVDGENGARPNTWMKIAQEIEEVL